jgi:hypothetical protein
MLVVLKVHCVADWLDYLKVQRLDMHLVELMVECLDEKLDGLKVETSENTLAAKLVAASVKKMGIVLAERMAKL